MEDLLRMGMRRTSIAPALLMGATIAAFGLALAPTPATAFVCGEVGGGGAGAGASPSGIACGFNAHAEGDDATAVGNAAEASGNRGTALGASSVAGGEQGGSFTNEGATAIGHGAQAGATAGGQVNATALGRDAHANAANAVAIGAGATANFARSIAIGAGTTRDNQVAIGLSVNTYTLAGINSQPSKDAQAGPIYMMTTDSAGNLAVSTFDLAALEDLPDTVAQNTTDIALLDNRVDGLESSFADLGGEISETRTEARQGIAAAIAMATAPMPSAPGKTTWASNVGFFKGETAFGGSLAHRFDTSIPFGVTAGYSYGGGDSHAARFGLMGEF